MRVTTLARLALAALVLGCVEPTASTGAPSEQTGGLAGSVTLIGTDGSDPAGVRLSLFATIADYEARRASYEVPLRRQPVSPTRTYAFELTGVAPGSYFLIACFEFGCGDYRDRDNGALIPVRIDKGRVTSVNFAL